MIAAKRPHSKLQISSPNALDFLNILDNEDAINPSCVKCQNWYHMTKRFSTRPGSCPCTVVADGDISGARSVLAGSDRATGNLNGVLWNRRPISASASPCFDGGSHPGESVCRSNGGRRGKMYIATMN